MEKKMKERSSESHPSSLEDGRVVMDFDSYSYFTNSLKNYLQK